MIIPIPNQPIDLEPNAGDDCNIGDNKAYCALYNQGDIIYWQGKQTPCGDDLICSPKFGFNVLFNPDFSLNLSDWQQLSGAWFWSSYGASINTLSTETLYQQVSSLIAGNSYTVTYTVANRSAGGVRVSLGGGSYGTTRSANGTYSETITAGSTNLNITFTPDTSFTGSITDVILTGSTACVTPSGYWIVGDTACYAGGGSGDAIQIDFTPIENTGYYQFKITVESMTGGSIQVFDVSGNYYDTITSNGVYTYYGVLSGNGLFIIADALFVGCITEVNVFELRQDIQVHLTDIDGTILEDISSSLTYSNDRLILKYDSSLIASGSGCYRIAVEDLCNQENFDLLSEVNTDVGFDSAGSWAFDTTLATPHPTMAVTSSKLRLTNSTSVLAPIGIARITYNWPSSGYYLCRVSMETGTITGGTRIYLYTPSIFGGAIATVIKDQVSSNTVYTKNIIISVDNINPSTANGVNYFNKMAIWMDTTPGNGNVNELKSFSVKLIPLNTNTFPWLSNCFNVQTSHDCAKLIEGWEESSDNYGVYRQGFFWPDTTGTAFRLSQRLRLLKFNPTYPTDSDDYEFSDGSRKSVSTKREKYYDCLFDYVDESALDALTSEVSCNNFQISGVDYFVKKEDFKPEWDREGRNKLAQIRMLIRKLSSTIYNSIV